MKDEFFFIPKMKFSSSGVRAFQYLATIAHPGRNKREEKR
jgi:hypothetical protein